MIAAMVAIAVFLLVSCLVAVGFGKVAAQREAGDLHHGATQRAAHRDKRLGIDAQIERAERDFQQGSRW